MKAKKLISIFMVGMMVFCLLTGCSPDTENNDKTDDAKQKAEQSNSDAENAETEITEGTVSEENAAQSSEGKILTAYFSMPEDIDTAGIDANSGASIVVKDGEVMGNVEYMAQTIQNTVGGDLFRIETVEQYPLDHDPLVDQAAEEQDADIRPELSSHIENPEQYETIFLGFPNWWGDMPQALYTFLEEYDFSGKTIIPFCPHGGSGFSGTESTIASLQPDAKVSDEGLAVSRNDVAGSADQVAAWAEGLGVK